jgi:chromosome transmission fidelity protein 1
VVATPTHRSSSVDIPQKRAAPDDLQGENEMPVVFSRTVSLGSRKQLCINDNVRSKSKDLDEGCRELLEGEFKSLCMLATNLISASEKGDKRCPYLPPIGEESRMVDFRDQILVRYQII